jgi:hypothetical protein
MWFAAQAFGALTRVCLKAKSFNPGCEYRNNPVFSTFEVQNVVISVFVYRAPCTHCEKPRSQTFANPITD